MSEPSQRSAEETTAERLARLEARLTCVEAHVGLASSEPPPALAARIDSAVEVPASVQAGAAEDEFEFEVGQNWFAKVGIVVLAIGVGFTLSLPFSSLPAGVPSLLGYLMVGVLFVVARAWQQSFVMMAGYLRGAAMALLFFATLRLFFFGAQHWLETDSLAGRAVLVLVLAINLAIAYYRKSPWLMGLALVTGYATLLAVGAAIFVLPGLVLLTLVAVLAAWRCDWPGLVTPSAVFGYLGYLLWALGNPQLTRSVHLVHGPWQAPGFLLAMATLLAAGMMLRRERDQEGPAVVIGALLNCGLGFLLFLMHSFGAFGPLFARMNLVASALFLGLAVAFWLRENSRVSTFFYAMTGYMALSMAITRESAVPAVFVWLSLQSVVVVATAIWFRSRFIVVANFLIYVSIVLGFMVLAQSESGISVWFGIVALISARILHWQKDRLELKTGLMRNAYLGSAFVIFPYALYHLVPARYVGPAWVGIALGYYLINLIVRSQKYRWMGHGTLLLTALYVLIVGISRFDGVYRVLSFLVLGVVLLAVSLAFTKLRNRQRPKAGGE